MIVGKILCKAQPSSSPREMYTVRCYLYILSRVNIVHKNKFMQIDSFLIHADASLHAVEQESRFNPIFHLSNAQPAIWRSVSPHPELFTVQKLKM